ncbi:unnamed protein product [Chironomus riparius]|uniref:Ionotropic receptor n=1 Tax=Chironomus riparius TaxID=315576 RepID=A0A9N9SA46_9DIPT|nr:unnamed protein product [Chironomus riparius]
MYKFTLVFGLAVILLTTLAIDANKEYSNIYSNSKGGMPGYAEGFDEIIDGVNASVISPSILFLTKLTTSQDTTILSIAIGEIIEEFYSKYSKNVDIIDFRGLQGDLIGKIMKKSNNSLTLTLAKVNNPLKFTKKLESQSILLFNHILDLNLFNKKDLIRLRYINPIRFLVYCQNATKQMLTILKTNLVIPPHFYFIIFDNSDQKFKLFTYENRKELKFCHESQRVVQINEFSEKTLQWTSFPVFPKKYQDFYNCIMVLGIPGGSNFFRILRQNVNRESSEGPMVKVLTEVADILNFTILGNACDTMSCLETSRKNRYLYNIISLETLDANAINMNENSNWKNILLNIECTPQLFIPPGDLYTSFEKVLLPFDFETWICLTIAMFSAVVAICIINRFPLMVKNIFYGSKVQSPMLNVVRGFFGIGQTILPKKNFARLILLSFILWCLVIRTAYQGKLFEFTTTAIRKPEMRTLEELKDKNFSLYMPDENEYHKILDFVKRVIGLNTETVSNHVYTEIYTNKISDPSFTGTVLTCDIEHQLNIYFSQVSFPKRFIPTPITKSFYAIGFLYPNLWNERLQEIIEGFITGGIINLHMERFTKSKWNLENNDFETEKVVLNLSHLGFGFQICFFMIYAAFLVFFGELIVLWKDRKDKLKVKLKAKPKNTPKFMPNALRRTIDVRRRLLMLK